MTRNANALYLNLKTNLWCIRALNFPRGIHILVRDTAVTAICILLYTKTDVCIPESTENDKGHFQWNYTLAGEYAFVLCPYGGWMDYHHDVPLYAFRPCNPPRQKKLLRNNRLSEDARWGEPDTQICRFTSNITNELREIREQILETIKELVSL